MSSMAFSVGTIPAFIVALGVLVVFHEWGHYVAARLLGVKVLRFSIGLGPVLWRRHWGTDQTEWAVSLLPLGGYVRMLDEREGAVRPEERERAFNRQSLGARSLIVLAGPLANLLLTWLIFSALYMVGLPAPRACFAEPVAGTPAALAGVRAGDCWVDASGVAQNSWQDMELSIAEYSAAGTLDLQVQGTDGQRHDDRLMRVPAMAGATGSDAWGLQPWNPPLVPVIGRVVAGSAAARAGLQVGDRIMAVANQPITDWQQLVQVIEPRAQQVTRLEVRRGTGQVTLTVVPQAVSLPSGKTVGRMGITPQISDTLRQQWTVMQSDPPLRALRHGFRQSWKLGQLSLVSLIHLVSGRGSWDDVGGPVRIASMAGESARLGLIPYLEFIAVVSLSLGILNLMPIPVLDGGHLLYHALEFVRGRPLSDAMMARTQQWGLLLLLGMMGFSFYNDLRQFFNQ